MRIIIFNTFYFPKFIGGAEISVQLLAEGLVKQGNTVFVITFGEERNLERINGVVVIRLRQRNIFSSFHNNKVHSKSAKIFWHLVDSFNPLYTSFIKDLLKRIKPDIIHTNNIAGFSPGVWAAVKLSNLPLLHTMRDYYLICHRTNMYNNDHSCTIPCKDCKITGHIKSGFMKYPDHFVGISNYILHKHESVIGVEKNKSVVYNGVNTDHMTFVKAPSNPESITFGFMGRISADKGAEYLISELQACDFNIKRKIKVILAGRGDNEYIEKLTTIAGDLNVEFIGVVKPELFFRLIDVLIVPSLWPEPFGRTVIEAFSFGVPVCISDSGGLGELYDAQSSWLYKPFKGHLTELIEDIVYDTHSIEYKKSNCFKSAKRFNETRYINEYQELYTKMARLPEALLAK